jgi:hypothetical protein
MPKSKQEQEPEKKLFAWVREQGLWIEPKLCPQIIHDVEMGKYLTKLKSMKIVKQYDLPPEDHGLSINALIEKYPAPEDVEEVVNEKAS